MILFKGGLIYDGTGTEPFKGDILVENDKIIKVEESILPEEGWETVDLTGLSVSSGFIDAHSHNDWFAIKKEPQKYFEPFIRQGITSFITGNCGLSAVGFESDTRYADKVGGGLFAFQDTTGVYPSVSEFFSAIDGNTPCNIALLAGHCTARSSVAGYENRQLTDHEHMQMLGIMEKALQEGACGLSLGLMYEPGIYADINELKDVARLCEKYDRRHPDRNLTWEDVYCTKGGKYAVTVYCKANQNTKAELIVNGNTHTATIADNGMATVTYLVTLKKGSNVITFGNSADTISVVDCMSLEKVD